MSSYLVSEEVLCLARNKNWSTLCILPKAALNLGYKYFSSVTKQPLDFGHISISWSFDLSSFKLLEFGA